MLGVYVSWVTDLRCLYTVILIFKKKEKKKNPYLLSGDHALCLRGWIGIRVSLSPSSGRNLLMQVFRTLERSWSALFKRSPSLSLSSSLSPTLSGNNFHANLMLTAPFYLKPEPRSRCQIKCLTSQRRKTGLLFKAAATHENLLTALRSKLLLPGSWTATPSQMNGNCLPKKPKNTQNMKNGILTLSSTQSTAEHGHHWSWSRDIWGFKNIWDFILTFKMCNLN